MLGRSGERRMKRVRKTDKDEERERDRGETTKRQIFPFCVHLAAVGDINDQPVSVDALCWAELGK